MRIIFMGTPSFALDTLAKLVASPNNVVAVYTRPPQRAGRGLDVKKSPVHALALKADIAVRTPKSLKDPTELAYMKALKPDVILVVAYGLLLPPAVLSVPRFGCLNLHASLLPRWRGASPIAHAILAGDSTSGLSVMKMAQGLDTGDVIYRAPVPLSATITAGKLHDTLAATGGRIITTVLKDYVAGKIAAKAQGTDGLSYAPKITDSMALLDWSQPADELERKVRALHPHPGAFCLLDGKVEGKTGNKALPQRLKVHAALVVSPPHKAPPHKAPVGTVVDDKFTVACGRGALRLTHVQLQGKKPLMAADFLRGFVLPVGHQLGRTHPYDKEGS